MCHGDRATILGQNLATVTPPGRGWRAEEIVDGSLPTSLEGVTVLVDGKPAAISFIGPGQINMQIPDVSPGRVSVRVAGPTGVSDAEAIVQSVARRSSLHQLATGMCLWQHTPTARWWADLSK